MLHLNLSIMYGSRVESQMETWIIFHRGSISLIEEVLVISRCCFAEDGWEMYTVLNRTCWAIVLPRVLEITSFCRSSLKTERRSKENNVTQNKAGIEKGMAFFRLITLFFFYENVYFWGRDWTFFKIIFFAIWAWKCSLPPMSDRKRISLYNINIISSTEVMRIKKNIS